MKRRKGLALVAGLVATVACSDDALVTAPEPTDAELAASVAGAAAAALDATGRFRLPDPQPTLAAQVSGVQAVALALAYSRQFAPLLREKLESEHGGRINLASLAACGRPLYAVNAFEEPPLDVLPAARRQWGPWWYVTLCEGSVPTLSVAVSAWATELTIKDGRISFPPNAGMELFGYGVRVGHSGEYPLSPERAAYGTARATGRKVVSVPFLLADGVTSWDPRYARWRWQLDEQVSVRTSARSVITAELFTGVSHPPESAAVEALFVPSATQVDNVQYRFPPPLVVGESSTSYEERVRTETRTETATRKPDLPVFFDRVVLR